MRRRLYLSQFTSSRQRERSSEELLEALLRYAAQQVPYYRDLFLQLGIVESNEVRLSRFEDIPLLDRQIIRQQGVRLHSEEVRPGVYRNTSGGSTGEPVQLLQDREFLQAVRYELLRQEEATGYCFGQSVVKLWGDEREVLKERQLLKQRFGRFFKNETIVNAFRLTPPRIREFLNIVQTRRPALLVAYVSALDEVCRYCEQNGVRFEGASRIITSAGVLSQPIRRKIEEITGAAIYNRYGSRELGCIACESSPGEGLRISEKAVWLEVLDDDGNACPPDVPGEIVVTGLLNYSMPLIRYKIGDRGKLHSEIAGVLQEVSGRTVDVFRASDGTLVDGEYFTHLLYFRKWIEKFEVLQISEVAVTVNIQSALTSVPEEDRMEIERGIRMALGQECKVSIELVHQMVAPSGGKHRYTRRLFP